MGIEAKHAYRFGYLKSEQWKTVRIEALAREKGKCQICADESIFNDAHHVWYPENIYETTAEHLVVLCRPCHDFVHAMMPECKTKSEEDGRAQWNKFRTAIITWRTEKVGAFKDIDDIEVPHGVKAIRTAYETLRNKYQDLLMKPPMIVDGDLLPGGMKQLRAAYEDLKKKYQELKLLTPLPSPREQLKFIVNQIAKWSEAYESIHLEEKFDVDKTDIPANGHAELSAENFEQLRS